MRNVRNWIFGLIAITVIIYLIFSFVHLTFDFTLWDNRFQVAGITGGFFVFWSIIYGLHIEV